MAKRPKHKVVKEDLLMPPNSILFVQNLPEGTTEATLSAMFSQYVPLFAFNTINR